MGILQDGLARLGHLNQVLFGPIPTSGPSIPTQTPLPGRAWGPSDVKSFEVYFSQVLLSQLYDYAYYCDTYRTINYAISREIFRNGGEWKPKFKSKCTIIECGAEFQTDIEKCEVCGAATRVPDQAQVTLGEKFVKQVNLAGQSLVDVAKSCEPDLEIIDNGYMAAIKQYFYNEEGEIKGAKLLSVTRGDPLFLRKIIDKYGRPGYDYFTNKHMMVCPHHRNSVQDGERCSVRGCGKKLYEAHFYTTGDQVVYFLKGEIKHETKYTDTLYYGFPPALTILTKVRTLLTQDYYIEKFYAGEKPPKGVAIIRTPNVASAMSAWDQLIERSKKDPHGVYPFFVPSTGQDTGKAVEFIDFMRSLEEMQFTEARQEFRDTMGALFGVSPIFNAGTKTGGLNNDRSLEITVTNRAFESGQAVYNEGFFPWIVEQLGITDWNYMLKPPEERDEMADLQKEAMKIQNAQLMKNLGFAIERLPNGDFKYGDKPEETPEPEVAPDPLFEAGLSSLAQRLAGTPAPIAKSGEIEVKKKSFSELAREAVFERRFHGMSRDKSDKIRTAVLRGLAGKKSVSDIADDIREITQDEEGFQPEEIARTETHAIRSILREAHFRELDPEDTNKYKWLSVPDDRRSAICKSISERTAKGVSMDELKSIVTDEAEKAGLEPRDWQPHPNCRSVISRVF